MTDTNEPFPSSTPRSRTTNILNVRLRPPGYQWVEDRVAEFDVDKSEIVKAALALAAARPKEFAALIEKRKPQK